MSEKSLFDKFPTIEDAQELIDILEEEMIEFSIIENAFDVDITFTGNKISAVQIFIDRADFDRVQQLKEAKADTQVDLSDKTHYLNKFSTAELYDVLEKRDEWSSYDCAFAKKLLEQRGEDVSSEFLESLKTKRNKELDKSERSSGFQIAVGYICAIMGGTLAILINGVFFLLTFTVIGLLIGWYLWKSKKTNTNGDKVFAYSENDRKHGKYISVIGILILSGYLGYRIAEFFSAVN